MQQYDEAIYNIGLIIKREDVANVRDGFKALEIALESLIRENKVLNNLDIAYSCDRCGQIFTPEDINNSTKEYFKDRIQVVEPLESVKINFSEYVCPRCGYKAIGKDFKRLK